METVYTEQIFSYLFISEYNSLVGGCTVYPLWVSSGMQHINRSKYKSSMKIPAKSTSLKQTRNACHSYKMTSSLT